MQMVVVAAPAVVLVLRRWWTQFEWIAYFVERKRKPDVSNFVLIDVVVEVVEEEDHRYFGSNLDPKECFQFHLPLIVLFENHFEHDDDDDDGVQKWNKLDC
jgi:hypothetical protein